MIRKPFEKKSKKNALKKIFAAWGIQPLRRDHSYGLDVNWKDEPPRRGVIRTTCNICGVFIGYRPEASKRRQPLRKAKKMLGSNGHEQ